MLLLSRLERRLEEAEASASNARRSGQLGVSQGKKCLFALRLAFASSGEAEAFSKLLQENGEVREVGTWVYAADCSNVWW